MTGAIPTRYAGVRFRSRLEARWAAFFDLVGWQWEYEPIDLAGYIPDFMLMLARPVLVEVKPIVRWPCPVPWCADPKCYRDPAVDAAVSKIVASGWTDEALLVGASPPEPSDNCSSRPPMGRFAIERWLNGEPACPGIAAMFICASCRGVSFCGWPHNDYSCRVCGHWDGDNHLGPMRDFRALWCEAGNRVQWRAPEGG